MTMTIGRTARELVSLVGPDHPVLSSGTKEIREETMVILPVLIAWLLARPLQSSLVRHTMATGRPLLEMSRAPIKGGVLDGGVGMS